jgi:hypothetical protein
MPGPLPAATVPVYRSIGPNVPIRLARGTIRIGDGRIGADGRGSIDMTFGSGSRVEFKFRARRPPPGYFADATRIEVPALGATGEALVTNSSWNGRSTLHQGTIHHGLAFGATTGLDGALAHVFNLRPLLGEVVSDPGGGVRAARTVMRGGGWVVTLDSLPEASDLARRMRAIGGHAITHVARIEREDGVPVDADALSECATVLGYLLSFARGAWTFPGLIVGYGAGVTRPWEHWTDPRLRPWSGVRGWLDDDHPEGLTKTFPSIWRLWRDPDHRPALVAGIGLLMDASEDVNLESRVVLAQAGLEHLAWHRLVVEGRWTETKFERKSAAQRIRGLISASGVAPGLPIALRAVARSPELRSKTGLLPADGPDFVVRVRNRTAHPPTSGPPFLPGDVTLGAWKLSLEYLQGALLGWLAYTGPVISPVVLGPSTFP